MESVPALQGLMVYLINLDRGRERLLRMQAKCDAAGLRFERVAAVDGAMLTFPHPAFSSHAYRYLHGRRVIPAEVGCYLSHVECARRLLASNAEHALILEDDVAFSMDFAELIQDAMNSHLDWDILRLSSVNTGPKIGYKRLQNGRNLAIALAREKGAGAYVINRKAATWITQKLIPMRLSYDIAFDLEFFNGLKAVFVDPAPVNQRDEKSSQIQINIKAYKYPKSRYLTVLPYRAFIEITRFVMRMISYINLSIQYQPGRTLLKVAPIFIAILLGVDEIFEDI